MISQPYMYIIVLEDGSGTCNCLTAKLAYSEEDAKRLLKYLNPKQTRVYRFYNGGIQRLTHRDKIWK